MSQEGVEPLRLVYGASEGGSGGDSGIRVGNGASRETDRSEEYERRKRGEDSMTSKGLTRWPIVVFAVTLTCSTVWAALTTNWRGLVWGFASMAIMLVVTFVFFAKLVSENIISSNTNLIFMGVFYPGMALLFILSATQSPVLSGRVTMRNAKDDVRATKFILNPFGMLGSVKLEHEVEFEYHGVTKDDYPFVRQVSTDPARLGLEGAEKIIKEQLLPDRYVDNKLEMFVRQQLAELSSDHDWKGIPDHIRVDSDAVEKELGDLDMEWECVIVLSEHKSLRRTIMDWIW